MYVSRRSGLGSLLGMLLVGLLAMPAAAQITIEPDTNDLVLGEGDTFDEVLTVTVPAETATSRADVYLLADTTGSMGTIIAAVRTGASDVVDGLVAALAGTDLRFGVGNYKDFPTDPYAFDHQLSITADATATKAQINNWSASGGNDGSEGQFFALDRLAADVDPAGGTIGWRTDAEKIIVWFGDAPAHDPVCAAISGLGFDITEASLTVKLQTANMAVISIGTTSAAFFYPDALDDDPRKSAGNYTTACGSPGGTSGQATRISDATGGQYQAGINSATIVSTIVDLISEQITTIESLRLVPAGDTAPFVVSIDPGSVGPIDTETETQWPFDVTFEGVVPCEATEQVFTGTIDVNADGSVEAQKQVTITVPACDTGCVDRDGDGYGSPGDAECPAGPERDCDDGDQTVFPGADEVCNGADDDCDGEVDEDLPDCDLLIVLDSFSAEVMKDGVMLRWRTLAEIDNAGFRVLRSLNGGTAIEQISERIIPARGSELSGASYEFFDSVDRRSLSSATYWIEDIDYSGVVTRHGPVTVQLANRGVRSLRVIRERARPVPN